MARIKKIVTSFLLFFYACVNIPGTDGGNGIDYSKNLQVKTPIPKLRKIENDIKVQIEKILPSFSMFDQVLFEIEALKQNTQTFNDFYLFEYEKKNDIFHWAHSIYHHSFDVIACFQNIFEDSKFQELSHRKFLKTSFLFRLWLVHELVFTLRDNIARHILFRSDPWVLKVLYALLNESKKEHFSPFASLGTCFKGNNGVALKNVPSNIYNLGIKLLSMDSVIAQHTTYKIKSTEPMDILGAFTALSDSFLRNRYLQLNIYFLSDINTIDIQPIRLFKQWNLVMTPGSDFIQYFIKKEKLIPWAHFVLNYASEIAPCFSLKLNQSKLKNLFPQKYRLTYINLVAYDTIDILINDFILPKSTLFDAFDFNLPLKLMYGLHDPSLSLDILKIGLHQCFDPEFHSIFQKTNILYYLICKGIYLNLPMISEKTIVERTENVKFKLLSVQFDYKRKYKSQHKSYLDDDVFNQFIELSTSEWDSMLPHSFS